MAEHVQREARVAEELEMGTGVGQRDQRDRVGEDAAEGRLVGVEQRRDEDRVEVLGESEVEQPVEGPLAVAGRGLGDGHAFEVRVLRVADGTHDDLVTALGLAVQVAPTVPVVYGSDPDRTAAAYAPTMPRRRW